MCKAEQEKTEGAILTLSSSDILFVYRLLPFFICSSITRITFL